MQFPSTPCHNSIHCVNWHFCRSCAPEFSDEVLRRFHERGDSSSQAYDNEVAKLKAEIAENHHEADEMDKDFQQSLRELAERCSACGQPLPKKD